MTPAELLEVVVSAHRTRTVDGEIQSSWAFHDLDAAQRLEAFDETLKQRAIERSLGTSSTIQAVLARLAARASEE